MVLCYDNPPQLIQHGSVSFLRGYLFILFSLFTPSECSTHSIGHNFCVSPCQRDALWGVRAKEGESHQNLIIQLPLGEKGSCMWPVLIPKEHPHSAGKVAPALGLSRPGQHGGSGAERERAGPVPATATSQPSSSTRQSVIWTCFPGS